MCYLEKALSEIVKTKAEVEIKVLQDFDEALIEYRGVNGTSYCCLLLSVLDFCRKIRLFSVLGGDREGMDKEKLRNL